MLFLTPLSPQAQIFMAGKVFGELLTPFFVAGVPNLKLQVARGDRLNRNLGIQRYRRRQNRIVKLEFLRIACFRVGCTWVIFIFGGTAVFGEPLSPFFLAGPIFGEPAICFSWQGQYLVLPITLAVSL